METLLIVCILIILVIAGYSAGRKGNKKDEEVKVKENKKLPYLIRDSFLTKTELSFYKALKIAVEDKALICPKVGLKDVFFVNNQKEYMKYFNQISKKHVDFLLCDTETMKPLCAIELDDFSHTNKSRYKRDVFVNKVFEDAGFDLIRFSSKSTYVVAEISATLNNFLNKTSNKIHDLDSIDCPKCNIPMVKRKVKNTDKVFYGCSNYPNCKEIRSL